MSSASKSITPQFAFKKASNHLDQPPLSQFRHSCYCGILSIPPKRARSHASDAELNRITSSLGYSLRPHFDRKGSRTLTGKQRDDIGINTSHLMSRSFLFPHPPPCFSNDS